ncbi:MAG: hypothetical protein IPH76_14730 [Xanthomonadales bacterium]|nr:hypothetical protein [Xanthomonadales bacterium]
MHLRRPSLLLLISILASAATAAETARYRVLPGGEAANKGRDVYSPRRSATMTAIWSSTRPHSTR